MILESKILSAENAELLAEWCKGVLVVERDALDNNITQPGINVHCHDGFVSGGKRASVGDTIVRHDDGSFDVYKK